MIKFLLSTLICSSFFVHLAGADDFVEGIKSYNAKNYVQAADSLFRSTRKEQDPLKRDKALLFTGLALYRLGLKQSASFPLLKLVKVGSPDYKKKALDVLISIADYLDDKSILNQSLFSVKTSDLSETAASVFYYRLGEAAYDRGDYAQAISDFNQSGETEISLFSLSLAQLKNHEDEAALATLHKLNDKFRNQPITDTRRGLAMLSLGEMAYGLRHFEDSAAYFRAIVKDSPQYRDALKGLSWSLFRLGRFRSALSPLQTLGTPFYANFYDPEVLLLHGDILLLSCHYDELNDILTVFDKNYLPAVNQLITWMQQPRTLSDYFKQLDQAYQSLARVHADGRLEANQEVPFFIVRTLLDSKDIKTDIHLLALLKTETQSAKKFFDGQSLRSGVGKYVNSILSSRSRAARVRMAKSTQGQLAKVVENFGEVRDQFEMLKYEALNGMKNNLRDKTIGVAASEIQDQQTRNYLIDNGYRLWPFKGEYWRDELGAYVYTGKNLCADESAEGRR